MCRSAFPVTVPDDHRAVVIVILVVFVMLDFIAKRLMPCIKACVHPADVIDVSHAVFRKTFEFEFAIALREFNFDFLRFPFCPAAGGFHASVGK